jgi:imidazolonepropionase-like amidohydrolase
MKRQLVIGFVLLACGFVGSCLWANGQKVVVIHAGQLFVGKSDGLLSNQVIVIQGDRIAEVGPAGSVKVPVGAQEIDLGRATVLPGLIDGHAHMFKAQALGLSPKMFLENSWQYRTILAVVNVKTDLEAGFTTERDMMSVGAMYSDTDVRRAINEGLIPGPRLQVATVALIGTGWGEGYGPVRFSPMGARAVDSPWEGRKAVRENIKYGADFIKVFADKPEGTHFQPDGRLAITPSMTVEEEEAIVDEAHRQGVKAACHAWGGTPLRDSIEVGCDSIEFGTDFDPESLIKLAEKGIFLTMELANGKAEEQADLKKTGGKYSRAAMQKATLQKALKAGVKIAFSSNPASGALDHGQQAKELEYLVDYGMKPGQALHSATTVNAEMMGWQDRVGSVEKGKYADIIAVSGNPLNDITELQRVKFVMKGGEIVRNDLSRSEQH